MKRIGLVVVVVAILAIVVWWLRREPETSPEGDADQASSSTSSPSTSTKSADDVRSQDGPAATARPADRDPEATRARWRALRDSVVRAREARVRRSSGTAGTPAGGDEEAIGTLDRHYIQAQMQEIKGLVQECYEDALRNEPGLEGQLVVEFVIGAEPDVGGIVEESHIDETSPLARSHALSECVSESMYALELRAPDGGGRVTVRYPFVFSAGDAG